MAAARRAEQSALAVRTRQRYEEVQDRRAPGQGHQADHAPDWPGQGDRPPPLPGAATVDELLAKVKDGRPFVLDDHKSCLRQQRNEGCMNVRQLHA